MSRPSLLVAAVVAFLVPAAAGAQTVDRAAIAKQLEANEKAVGATFEKGDTATFKKFVADDAIAVDASGTMTGADVVKMMPQIKVASQTWDQFRVIWANDATAVVAYRWTYKATMNGQAMPSPVYASSVWTNRGGKWTMVYHQETTAAPPAPPAKK